MKNQYFLKAVVLLFIFYIGITFGILNDNSREKTFLKKKIAYQDSLHKVDSTNFIKYEKHLKQADSLQNKLFILLLNKVANK